MPFDGCITPYESVCHLINTDFVNFDKNLQMCEGGVVNTELNIIYNHEKILEIESVAVQLNLRKNQFINSINITYSKEDAVIIFFLVHNKYPEELVNVFLQKYPTLKFKIFALDYNIYPVNKDTIHKKWCKYINIPKPSEKYVEYMHRETPEGQVFENRVVTEFLNFISEITSIKYSSDAVFLNRSMTVE